MDAYFSQQDYGEHNILDRMMLIYISYLGEKFDYDPDFQGPDRSRYPTDRGFCYAFLVFVVLWCAAGDYGSVIQLRVMHMDQGFECMYVFFNL